MNEKHYSYRLSELPPNLMVSPKFLLDWWDEVSVQCSIDQALNSKEPDFKLARELWVAAVFASCKRLSSGKEHWVSRVDDIAPDAWVAYFEEDELGFGRHIYQLEVTTYSNGEKRTLEEVIKAKLDKAYTQDTRIICYVSRSDKQVSIDLEKLVEFITKHNPSNYEVWLLASFEPSLVNSRDPLMLYCLTSNEDYQIDLAIEKQTSNKHEAWLVSEHKGTSRDHKPTSKGSLRLELPECKARQ